MKVRKDVAVRANDEARAFALDRFNAARTPPRIVLVRRSLKEKVLKRRSLSVSFFGDFNDNNGRCDDFENLGESIVQLVDNVLALLGGRGRNGRRRDAFGRRPEDRHRAE